MKPNLYQEKHRITYYETGLNNRLSLEMLLNLAVLVSEDQVDHLSEGTSFLQKRYLGWVVIQYSIHVNRLPRNDEIVTLATRSNFYNRLLAEREFIVKDSKGRLCARIDSNWILLNLKTRQLALIQPKLIQPYGTEPVKLLPHLRRPYPIKNDPKVISRSYRVRNSDIDMNHHVNNAKYLNWMCDILSPKFLLRYRPEEVDIKFSHEVRYGTNVISRVEEIKRNPDIITRHEIKSGGQLAAVANVKWVPVAKK